MLEMACSSRPSNLEYLSSLHCTVAAELQHCALPDRERWPHCGPGADCEQPTCPGSLAELAAGQQPAVLPWQPAAWSHPRSAVQPLAMASTYD